MFAFLVVALLATLAVAIVGWFRPVSHEKTPAATTYTNQQVADAKSKVCDAYAKVHSAVRTSMARDPGNDPTSQLAVATSARQALLAGSEYLLTTLSAEPAAPAELASAIKKLSTLFQQYTIDYLNGQTNQEIQSELREGDEITVAIERQCK